MRETEETQVRSLGQEDPLEEGMATHFLRGESRGQRNLAGYRPWGRKESDTTEATEHKLWSACAGRKRDKRNRNLFFFFFFFWLLYCFICFSPSFMNPWACSTSSLLLHLLAYFYFMVYLKVLWKKLLWNEVGSNPGSRGQMEWPTGILPCLFPREKVAECICLKWISINLGLEPVCRGRAPLVTRVEALPCSAF